MDQKVLTEVFKKKFKKIHRNPQSVEIVGSKLNDKSHAVGHLRETRLRKII